MNVFVILAIVLGCLINIGIIGFLVSAWCVKNQQLPAEKTKPPRLTIYPVFIRINNIKYAGPFSRISVYDDLIIIRALGQTRMITRDRLSHAIEYSSDNIVMYIHENEFVTKITIFLDCDSGLFKAMDRWEKEEGL
jgi:hypothetical protein